MKWIDLPPFWLLLCLVLAWLSPIRFAPGVLIYIGWLAIGVGLLLTLLAILAFRRARTTIIPREAPQALITQGIFARTRNPIYLADVLFLAGASLNWGSAAGLVLVPLFAILLQRRFIQAEEAVLTAAYGSAFQDYAKTVRRWI